jgi:uncharacterized membrane protein
VSPIIAFHLTTALARVIWAIRGGNVCAHRHSMIGAFAGTAIAGAFTLLPGRIIGDFVFGG